MFVVFLTLFVGSALAVTAVGANGIFIGQSETIAVNQSATCQMTPPNLMNDFLEKCSGRKDTTEYDCTTAWEKFAQSFANKPPSEVQQSDYIPYFDYLPIVTQPNQQLFWSGTHDLVGLLSCMCSGSADIISSANLPASAIVNDIGNIHWCGNEGGIDYSSPCLCSVTNNFWNQFSVEFASVARGTVFYLAYGEREGGTFQSTSAFAQHEVPNLAYPRVTEAIVLNVHRKEIGEACGEGTLSTLEDLLKSKQFKYTCYNIYGDLSNGSTSNLQSLSSCASSIISSSQNGVDPDPDDCFSDGHDLRCSFCMVMILLVLLYLATNKLLEY